MGLGGWGLRGSRRTKGGGDIIWMGFWHTFQAGRATYGRLACFDYTARGARERKKKANGARGGAGGGKGGNGYT